VPDYAFNILNLEGLLYRPVVDEDRIKSGDGKPAWPEGKPFAVCLTHDVDHVSTRSVKQVVRRKRMQSAFSKGPRHWCDSSMDVVSAGLRSLQRDPIHCYEKWLDLEKTYGHSTFFFSPGLDAITRRHANDLPYELSDKVVFRGERCTVAEMIREIDQSGWEIGLHPSWYSFDDAGELRRQKDALEAVVGHPVVSVRQHNLHYDIRYTPAAHARAGFLYDSSLGFNDNIGFRFGTSYPWRLYDIERSAELAVLEVPLIIQEWALLNPAKGMRLDEATAFEYILRISEAVEAVGGVVTLLWHPEYIVNQSWLGLYRRTLDHLAQKNAWFGTVAEVGTWWTDNRLYRTVDA
jgi:peptidoglycan/xylan/chitin deacetylase (PgdA/CDA1 family)